MLRPKYTDRGLCLTLRTVQWVQVFAPFNECQLTATEHVKSSQKINLKHPFKIENCIPIHQEQPACALMYWVFWRYNLLFPLLPVTDWRNQGITEKKLLMVFQSKTLYPSAEEFCVWIYSVTESGYSFPLNVNDYFLLIHSLGKKLKKICPSYKKCWEAGRYLSSTCTSKGQSVENHKS